MLGTKLIDEIKELVSPVLKEDGICLIDINVSLNPGRLILRLLVDKTHGGITIDECARLNEKIGNLIDQADLIKQRYILEISSPGIDRPLRTPEDFSRCVNRKIRVFLNQCEDAKYEISGPLTEVSETGINLELEGKIIRHIPFAQIKNAKQIIEVK